MSQTGRFSIAIDEGVIEYLNTRTRQAKNALKRAVRAAFIVIRQGAISMLPTASAPGALFQLLQRAAGYKVSVDTSSDFQVVGRFYARPPANLVQAGFKAHWAPLNAKGPGGETLADWFEHQGLKMLIYRGGKRVPEHLRRSFFIRAQQGRPFVVPAAEAYEAAAVDAFNETIWEAIL
ncbi:MAG: hypothetical protein ACYCW6_00025 [Candidatus Xenobia bacterium]